MPKALFFDLDNTLYDQTHYYAKAFAAVARFLSVKYTSREICREEIIETLWNILKAKGSLYGFMFNDLLNHYRIENPMELRTIIKIFHDPPLNGLSMYEDFHAILPVLKNRYTLGIITNGDTMMQQRKIDALCIDDHFKTIVYTHQEGHPKPGKYCYLKALTEAGCKGSDAVCIGDNPVIDFIGAKQVGMKTMRLLRGEFAPKPTDCKHIDFEFRDYTEFLALMSKCD